MGIWKLLAWGLEAGLPVSQGASGHSQHQSIRPSCSARQAALLAGARLWLLLLPLAHWPPMGVRRRPLLGLVSPVSPADLRVRGPHWGLLKLAGWSAKEPRWSHPSVRQQREGSRGHTPHAESHFCQCDRPSGWVSTGAHSIWGSPQPTCSTLNLTQREG